MELDPDRVRSFRIMWAQHEAWWQAGRPGLDEYSWPIPGTRAMVDEGREAYFAYRDYLVGFMLATDGFAELLDDLRAMIAEIRAKHEGEPERLLSTVGEHDSAFHAQWNNLFGDVLWKGVSHATLAAYVQKYEVEWPFRFLACLRGLLSNGRYDPALSQFRDRGGRLRKGVVIDYIAQGFGSYPAFRTALVQGYSVTLRNLIAHNSYVLDEAEIKAIDGSYVETYDGVWRRVQALGAIQNSLVWLQSTSTQDPRALAPKGVLGLGWMPLADDGVPELLVLQLAAFRKFDPRAEWLDHGKIVLDGDRVSTRLGIAKAHEGKNEPILATVLDRVRALGGLVCHVTAVMPCLHATHDDHAVFTLGDHRYCQSEDAVSSWIPVTIADSSHETA